MSLKIRITAWFSIMILMLTALVVSIVFVVADESLTDDPVDELVKVVSINAATLRRDSDQHGSKGFQGYRNGVYCQLMDPSGHVLLGSAPEGVAYTPPLENGAVVTCSAQPGDYYIYDTRVDHDTWVRGYISTTEPSETTRLIILCTLIILPIIVLLSITGGWLITRHSLRPIDTMLSAVESINGGDDLSRRVGLEKGSSELRRLGNEFDKMIGRLRDSFDAERQFSSDVSHELRTPITVALGECDSVKKSTDLQSCKASVVIIEKQCCRISALTDSLLRLTRLQQKTDAFPLTQLNFSDFLEVCCEDFAQEWGFQPEASSEGHVLTMDIEKNITARYHPELMSMVIFNLLDNARKYGGPQGHIHVSLRSQQSSVLLTVRDNGIGIPPEDLPKIWNRFWQADRSRGTDAGIGLGLAMVKEMVTFQGGTVTAESEYGSMTQFTIRLQN